MSSTLVHSPSSPYNDAVALARQMLSGQVDGTNISDAARLKAFAQLVSTGKIQTLSPLLPLLLNLDGKPYSLKNHYQFEPIFRTRRAKKTLLISGRQVSKSTSEAADGVVQANCIPYYKILYVTPLFEQARRLSSNYVRKFIDQSPVRHLFQGVKTENSVLQKSFSNFSLMHFSFAMDSADRVRGISTDRVSYDECQDMDRDHFSIIEETLSASPWGFVQYAGTPKTRENTISGLHGMSSQAEWFIPCHACGKDNICSTEFDLDKIIGPYWKPADGQPFIGTICANPKCRRIIDPADGFWVHRYPERRWSFAGYHIPQPIMHLHYSSHSKWAHILAKREGAGNYTPAKYHNEVLGEACGSGSQLVSLDELNAASTLPWKNNPREMDSAAKQSLKYDYRVLAIDWGGGGEDEISLTTMAVLGWLSNGQIHVIWGRRLMTPHDHVGEAEVCRQVYSAFRCHFIAHDYTGAGALRETVLRHRRVPLDRIIPIAYVGPVKRNIMSPKAATDIHPRNHYILDKSRSLQLVCACIKFKMIRFFQPDFISTDDPGLIQDFLGLVENKIPTKRASDIYTIQKHAMLSDDFAQAVNIGSCALWHMTKRWPNLGEMGGVARALDNAQMHAATLMEDDSWDNDDGDHLTEFNPGR